VNKKTSNKKTVNKKGSKAAKGTKARMTTYETIDNGAKPFAVCVSKSKVEVYSQKFVEEYDEPYWVHDKKVMDTPYKDIWIGDNYRNEKGYAKKGEFKGNSVIIQTAADSYTFVGNKKYSFHLGDDTIEKFCSPLGNSSVPYPYIIGKNRSYFMLNRQSVDNELLKGVDDMYWAFYNLDKGEKKAF
jgi:hypothetical protein